MIHQEKFEGLSQREQEQFSVQLDVDHKQRELQRLEESLEERQTEVGEHFEYRLM